MKQENKQGNEYISSRASTQRSWAPGQMSVGELTEKLEAGIGKSLRVEKEEFDSDSEEVYFRPVLGSLEEGEYTSYYYVPDLIVNFGRYSGDPLFEEQLGSKVRQVLDRQDIMDWVDKNLISSDYSPRILSLDECISDIDGSFKFGDGVNHYVGSLDGSILEALRARLILDRSDGDKQNVRKILERGYHNCSTYALNCLRWNVSAPKRDLDEWSTSDDNEKSWTANNAHVSYGVLQKMGVDSSHLQQEQSLLQEMDGLLNTSVSGGRETTAARRGYG